MFISDEDLRLLDTLRSAVEDPNLPSALHWWLEIEPEPDDSGFIITASRPGDIQEIIGCGRTVTDALYSAQDTIVDKRLRGLESITGASFLCEFDPDLDLFGVWAGDLLIGVGETKIDALTEALCFVVGITAE